MGELAKLPNIGKVNEQKLISAGITTTEQLRGIGSRVALLRIRAHTDPSTCLSTLFSLEGAIRGVRWHELSESVKSDLKMFYDEISAIPST